MLCTVFKCGISSSDLLFVLLTGIIIREIRIVNMIVKDLNGFLQLLDAEGVPLLYLHGQLRLDSPDFEAIEQVGNFVEANTLADQLDHL